MKSTEESLSVVLPVFNSAATLAERISDLLEILPDITSRFEVLILDNGSTDQTEEIAHDLARQFPQLSMIRHANRLDERELMRTGFLHTSGDLVVVYDEESPLRKGELRRMWSLRKNEQQLVTRPETRDRQPTTLDRLASWSTHLADSSAEINYRAGIQMIRRRAIDKMESPESSAADQRMGNLRARMRRLTSDQMTLSGTT